MAEDPRMDVRLAWRVASTILVNSLVSAKSKLPSEARSGTPPVKQLDNICERFRSNRKVDVHCVTNPNCNQFYNDIR